MDNSINIYFKKDGKKYKTEYKTVYKTGYGLPFQCVELIRRFFSIIKDVSFPSVIDAVEFYNKIDKLSNSKIDYKLKTFSYPYEHNYDYYLKPGSILFWKYKKPDFIYGHVALVLDSNNETTTIIQQNLNPPVKIYDTKTLFEKMNNPKSKFLGIKIIPKKLAKNIELVNYNIIRL
jgi:hypothetical protein